MLKVRKWMTEILLEVTNNEIELIAKEVLNKSSDRGICAYNDFVSNLTYILKITSMN